MAEKGKTRAAPSQRAASDKGIGTPQPPFIHVELKQDGQGNVTYDVSSNLGDAWQIHVVKMAKALRRDWFGE